MKKLFLAAVLIAFSAASLGSASAAAPNLTKNPQYKVHDGTNIIKAGKDSYTVTVTGGKVVSVVPNSSMSGMAGSHMSTKSVHFTKTSKNAICYYWWRNVYGQLYYVWEYC